MPIALNVSRLLCYLKPPPKGAHRASTCYRIVLAISLWMPYCLAIAEGQTGFHLSTGARFVQLSYQLLDPAGQSHSLDFRLSRKAVKAADRMFRPIDTRALREQGSSRRNVLTERAIDQLELRYPQVQFELAPNQVIKWRISLSKRDRAMLQQAYRERLASEIEQLNGAYAQPKVHRDGDDALTITAASAREMAEVRKAVKLAMQRARQATDRSVQQADARLKRVSHAVREQLQSELQTISAELGDWERDFYYHRGYLVVGDTLVPNYAGIAAEALRDLHPVALALKSWTRGLSKRQSIARLLSFVQSIPYDELRDRETDSGFLAPLSVIAQNRGDCDSKAVLFAALLRKLHPDTPVAMILLERHALLGIDIPAEKGDVTLKHQHRNWVLAEPVGPGLTALGKTGDQYRRARQIESVIRFFD